VYIGRGVRTFEGNHLVLFPRYKDDQGSKFSQNIGTNLPNYTRLNGLS
jgi:hypothetical protein